MADFEKAYKLVYSWENRQTKAGLIVYSNIGADKGGETVFGVARNLYPRLSLWELVDKHKQDCIIAMKKQKRPINLESSGFALALSPALINDVELCNQVRSFYYNNFWLKMIGDKIPNQAFAENLFLLSVNAGVKRGVKVGQEACGFMGKDIDGILGKNSTSAFIKAGANEVKKFTEIEIRFYTSLVFKDPIAVMKDPLFNTNLQALIDSRKYEFRNESQKIFLIGWLRRARAV